MSSANRRKADGKPAPMSGADYVAVKSRLTNAEGAEVAALGGTCEQVDPASLPWLLEQGYIEPKAAPVADEAKE